MPGTYAATYGAVYPGAPPVKATASVTVTDSRDAAAAVSGAVTVAIVTDLRDATAGVS